MFRPGMGKDQAALVQEIAGEALATETPPPLVWLRSEDGRAAPLPLAPCSLTLTLLLTNGWSNFSPLFYLHFKAEGIPSHHTNPQPPPRGGWLGSN